MATRSDRGRLIYRFLPGRALRTTKLILVIFLVVGLPACKQTSGDQRANDLMRETVSLREQSTKLTAQWSSVYRKEFTTENQAKFPSNRDSLRASADKIIAILDEDSSVTRRMLEKYEEASPLLSKDDNRRAVDLIIRALRNTLEVNELLKAQMRLVSDEEIKDGRTLNEKIMQSWQQVHQKQDEGNEQFQKGKELLGG